MTQGAEGDLLDIRFYGEDVPVNFVEDNEPFTDLNTNILTVDNKAILARDTALQIATDLSNHEGAIGPLEHADATTTLAGFISAADQVKLNSITEKAQVNTLAPSDALSLISRKDTILHQHPTATSSTDGFNSAVDKDKLDNIEALAQVNNISALNAATLIGGGLADTLHSHAASPGSETFTMAVHDALDHTGVSGVPGFPGFSTAESYIPDPIDRSGRATWIHSHTYSFAPETIQAGWRKIQIRDQDYSEGYSIDDVALAGNDGLVTYTQGYSASANCVISVWQGAFG